jgi:hypothetical protein
MRKTVQQVKKHLMHKQFFISLCIAFLLLALSLILNYYAGTYATREASNSVTDIILDNLPVFDVDWFFVYGAFIFWAFISLLLIYDPKKAPFVLKSVALFIIVRSIFISLTHIGPFPGQILIEPNRVFDKVSFGADLFFSGHTGFPVLFALIYWEIKPLRIFFLASSVIFGACVLIGHLHYSIDVFSAFFITYGIFQIATKFFKQDYKIFQRGISAYLS